MSDVNQHLDSAALSELKDVMGDEFPLLIDTFATDSVARIETIRAAVDSADPEAIRRTAHSFKGSSGNMGALVLTELCRRLEDMGSSGQSEGSQQLLESIIEEYEHVHQALSSL